MRSGCLTVGTDISQGVSHPTASGVVPSDLTLSLFADVLLNAHLWRWTKNTDGSFTWIGDIVEAPGGTAVITVVNGEYSGVIRYDKMTYIV